MPDNASREVMTLKQAAQYLGVTTDTLYKLIGPRNVPAFKIGKRWRFKKELLDRWMEQESEKNGNGRESQ